ncbi:hypothetical protein [Marinobacter sp. LN3S78]|uniref:hypothetical protein n=1 Tax=Marinobacter sp. LN3S78 TaxID=3382300 RepID=UPI00387AE1F7
MPAAKDNRKPVGRADCADCGTVAAFYQVTKGKRAGYLYKRCGCGCDQSSGKAKQQRWLSEMEPTGEPMIDHPLDLDEPAPEPAGEPGSDPEEPEPEPSREPTGEPNRAGVLGLVAMAAAVGFALFS